MATQDIDRELSVMIGERNQAARALAGVSQTQLGEMLGITFQQIQKYEKGSNRISAPMLIRLAKALDQPIEFFTNTAAGKASHVERFTARDIKLLHQVKTLPDDVARAVSHLLTVMARQQT